jgi:hypothetical protein
MSYLVQYHHHHSLSCSRMQYNTSPRLRLASHGLALLDPLCFALLLFGMATLQLNDILITPRCQLSGSTSCGER